MKGHLQWIMALCLITPAFGQPADPPQSTTAVPPERTGRSAGPTGGTFSERIQEINRRAAGEANADNKSLPRFDLDFPGGTPSELVKAIEKASGKPLNAVIREEDANCRLAAISVKNVNVAQLFSALIEVSREQQVFQTGTMRGSGSLGGIGQYSYHNSYFGFKTEGTPTENSIWYFVRD